MFKLVVTLFILLVIGTLGSVLFVWRGWYDISANVQHTQAVYSLLETTMHRSVKRRAADIAPPKLDDAALVSRGAQCYVEKCVQCHGGPGVAQGDIGRSMQPLPGPLADSSKRWQPQELYWITRNGIKMSGMPAWQYRLADADLWAVVAFMQRLPALTAVEFRSLAGERAQGACDVTDAMLADATMPAPAPTGSALQTKADRSAAPDPDRGKIAVTQFACNACHLVPGVTGSKVYVGPPLAGIAGRGLIAGAVPNTPEQMVRWIRDPQAIDPQTTMPNMQVGERDARDIAAYLATLH